MTIDAIRAKLKVNAKSDELAKRYFKTNIGDYAAHDKFLGVGAGILRNIAKEYPDLTLPAIYQLLQSAFNEERLLALIILVSRYKRANILEQEEIYQFYLQHKEHVNNWNLVDNSAHLIMGKYLLDKDQKTREILFTLSESNILWDRRIAIVATWSFIKNNDFALTLDLAEILINDEHDLIHKAVGWMLRELGKKDLMMLTDFLDQKAQYMPRTMLRYAIERLPDTIRKYYLLKKKI